MARSRRPLGLMVKGGGAVGAQWGLVRGLGLSPLYVPIRHPPLYTEPHIYIWPCPRLAASFLDFLNIYIERTHKLRREGDPQKAKGPF